MNIVIPAVIAIVIIVLLLFFRSFSTQKVQETYPSVSIPPAKQITTVPVKSFQRPVKADYSDEGESEVIFENGKYPTGYFEPGISSIKADPYIKLVVTKIKSDKIDITKPYVAAIIYGGNVLAFGEVSRLIDFDFDGDRVKIRSYQDFVPDGYELKPIVVSRRKSLYGNYGFAIFQDKWTLIYGSFKTPIRINGVRVEGQVEKSFRSK